MPRENFRKETDFLVKGNKLEIYYEKQNELKLLISEENKIRIRENFEKMLSKENGFWYAYRRL